MAATTTASNSTRGDLRRFGLLGRLGLAVTRHSRITTVLWLPVIFGLGIFAPRVEGALSGAGWQADGSYTPWVTGIVLSLGFVLLLVALQAPFIALLGTVVSLLSTAAAFGLAPADLPEWPRRWPARIPGAGFPRRMGAGVLLRDDLRHRHGLHRLPAGLRQGALGKVP